MQAVQPHVSSRVVSSMPRGPHVAYVIQNGWRDGFEGVKDAKIRYTESGAKKIAKARLTLWKEQRQKLIFDPNIQGDYVVVMKASVEINTKTLKFTITNVHSLETYNQDDLHNL